jgi:ring-1,2-phenylacetyl-CoA epoxidase subunit PaaB
METKDTQGDRWEVFTQSKPGIAFKHSGSLHAYDKEMAIKYARDLYTRRNEGTGLWVIKSSEIISVPSEDEVSFFEPAKDKIYRQATFYQIPDGVTHL